MFKLGITHTLRERGISYTPFTYLSVGILCSRLRSGFPVAPPLSGFPTLPPGWDWARADAPFTFVKGALSALGLAPPFGEPCVREWAPQPRGPRFALGGAGGYVVLSY